MHKKLILVITKIKFIKNVELLNNKILISIEINHVNKQYIKTLDYDLST